jgi:hypothetical protein
MTPTRFETFAHWLLQTARGRVVLWWLEWLSFVAGILMTGWSLYMVEHHFFPVIKDWKLSYIYKKNGNFILGGTLYKTRACELISTSVMAVPKVPLAPRQLVYQVKPQEVLGGNAPTGFVTWGPWEVVVPKALVTHRDQIAFLEVVGHHRCHALWTQETLYGTVSMEELP